MAVLKIKTNTKHIPQHAHGSQAWRGDSAHLDEEPKDHLNVVEYWLYCLLSVYALYSV